MPLVALGALGAIAVVAYGIYRRWTAFHVSDYDVPEEDDSEVAGATEVDPVRDFGQIDTYKPHSPEAIALFEAAAARVGLPVEWGSQASLHNILNKESKGRVGIPNYTYLPRSADPANWPAIWDELRQGRYTGNRITKGPEEGKFSSASGLGQLTLPNVRRYYPDGVQGIGDALNEAAGMLRYIQDRYGDPDNAWSRYGTRGEGY